MERLPQNTKDLRSPKPEKLYEHNHDDDKNQDQDQDQEEEDIEEALSLRDLPLNTTKPSTATATAADRHDPAAAAEFFEFLSSTSYDLSPAEDIIFRGKLIPLNDQTSLRGPFSSSPAKISGYKDGDGRNSGPRIRARSESLSAIQGNKLNRSGSVTRGGGDIKFMRNSRSLDYRKLTRVSSIVNSSPPDPNRKSAEKSSPAAKSVARSDTASFGGKSVRPRWYVMMFGMVKFPPEIELRDMKSRQSRRNINPPAMFPSSSDRSAGGRSSHSQSPSSSPSSSWKFLKALSCKEPNSAAVTAPFWVPHAR